MPYTRASRIWQAMVAHLRSVSSVETALTGGIHRGVSPEKARYPLAIYRPVTSPYEDAWGSRMIVAVVDIIVVSDVSVDADNIDQAISEALDNAVLTVDGQEHLVTRRVADLDLDPELDDNAKKVYPIGGTYEIWTHQSSLNPSP